MFLSNKLLWALKNHEEDHKNNGPMMAEARLIENLIVLELARDWYTFEPVRPIKVSIDKVTGEVTCMGRA